MANEEKSVLSDDLNTFEQLQEEPQVEDSQEEHDEPVSD